MLGVGKMPAHTWCQQCCECGSSMKVKERQEKTWAFSTQIPKILFFYPSFHPHCLLLMVMKQLLLQALLKTQRPAAHDEHCTSVSFLLKTNPFTRSLQQASSQVPLSRIGSQACLSCKGSWESSQQAPHSALLWEGVLPGGMGRWAII